MKILFLIVFLFVGFELYEVARALHGLANEVMKGWWKYDKSR